MWMKGFMLKHALSQTEMPPCCAGMENPASMELQGSGHLG